MADSDGFGHNPGEERLPVLTEVVTPDDRREHQGELRPVLPEEEIEALRAELADIVERHLRRAMAEIDDLLGERLGGGHRGR